MMNAQQLEYVRIELSAALANFTARTKGQLEAFEDSPLGETGKYKRQPLMTVKSGDRKVRRYVDPVFSAETRNRRLPAPPIEPETFSSSSWRRALGMLPRAMQAWLKFAYGRNINFNDQQILCYYVMNEFRNKDEIRKISRKVRDRCRRLVWMALQQSAGMILRDNYAASELAALVDVKPDNWSKNYAARWSVLLFICKQLDESALESLYTRRSKKRVY